MFGFLFVVLILGLISPKLLSGAIDGGHVGIVKMLLKSEIIDINTFIKGNTGLHIAISKGYRETARVLLQNEKIHINASNKDNLTGLHLAILNGQVEIVKMLLKNIFSPGEKCALLIYYI